MNIAAFFWPQTIALVNSKYNRQIKIVEFLGRRYIDVGGLMQSGGFLEKIFAKGIKKLHISTPKKILVLGLGGGSIINVFNKFYPLAAITAVEIDQKMIDVGRKYLNLNNARHLKIIVKDAFEEIYNIKDKYDLIFIDLYHGYEIAGKISRDKFLLKLKLVLNKNGNVIFNHIYFRNHISEANKFLDKLKEVFHYVITTKIYSNILVCAK